MTGISGWRGLPGHLPAASKGQRRDPADQFRHPEIKVLMLTLPNRREYVDQARLAGAEGYFLKDGASAPST
jgi:DNA-binding NarL/FixJ family response regulator